MSNRFIDFLFTPAAVFASIVVLVACVIGLWTKRKSWPVSIKLVIGVIAALCIAYLALIAVMSIGFGQTPPVPVPAPPV